MQQFKDIVAIECYATSYQIPEGDNLVHIAFHISCYVFITSISVFTAIILAAFIT